MDPGTVIVLIVGTVTGSKILREWFKYRADHRREQRKLEHEIKLARIQAGLLTDGGAAAPDESVQREIHELRRERLGLQERVEHLESIVTSASMEVNLRLSRLLADVPAGSSSSVAEPTLSMERRSAFSGGSEASRVGQHFAERYELLSELGRGGMAIVYQARDTKLGQTVTLKVLSPLVARDRRALDRFRHEASATRQINHPNVIRIYDLGEAAGEPYISMEYFPGVDLKHRVRAEGRLPQRECIRIVLAIAEGIRAAHEIGVIHRDLKPQNVLVGASGQVKVIDFGLAKSALMGGLTVSGFILGTPQYMSPEQIQGKEIDLRSDIYSLGVVAYEVRCGRTPFDSDSPIEASFKTLQTPPPPLTSLAPDTASLYEEIVQRCLQKNPVARYQRMDDVISELKRLV